MADRWWDRLARIVGLEHMRVELDTDEPEEDHDMDEAQRRLRSLDIRVTALGRRMNTHERRSHR